MSQKNAIRVSIVEDEPRFRESLALLVDGTPGIDCVSSYHDGAAALLGLPADHADVVMLDINLPKMDGIDCLRNLKPHMADTQFIMLTTYNDDERIFQSLAAGASGYLLKRSTPAEILEAIIDVHAGGSPMSSSIARRVVQSFASKPPGKNKAMDETGKLAVSPREHEVLTLLSKGFLYKEIAAELAISLDTVRTHLRRIYEKLHVHSRTEAVVKFLERD